MIHATNLVELKGIMLSDKSQSQKVTYSMTSFILPTDTHHGIGETQENHGEWQKNQLLSPPGSQAGN